MDKVFGRWLERQYIDAAKLCAASDVLALLPNPGSRPPQCYVARFDSRLESRLNQHRIRHHLELERVVESHRELIIHRQIQPVWRHHQFIQFRFTQPIPTRFV